MNCKLSSQDADFMRMFYEFGFTQSQLAREYEVHPDTVRNVVTGRSFKGGPPRRSKKRKLTDDQARQVHKWADEGFGEVRIQRKLHSQGIEIGRSTVRQVINGQSYQDVT